MKLASCSKDGKEFVCVITNDNKAVPVVENGFNYKSMNGLLKKQMKKSLWRFQSFLKAVRQK